jgi:hypothetical protein
VSQPKLSSLTHYGESSRFKPSTMCGLASARVRYTSDLRNVNCPTCLKMEHEGAVLHYGGGRIVAPDRPGTGTNRPASE